VLDIVTHSLYTEREIFLRELVSNACDALEKTRLTSLTHGKEPGLLEVSITTGEGTLTVQDSGCGLTKAELQSHLGIIAKSGTSDFAAQEKSATSLIGRFGVGFYASFMVADRVDVYTKSERSDTALHWSSDGGGTYTITPCAADLAPQRGTRIVLHLKPDAVDMFSHADGVKEVLSKHSAFVAHPVSVDGTRVNTLPAVWTFRPSEVTEEQHEQLYRSLGGIGSKPPFRLHFATDAPLSLHALIYVPSRSGEMLGFATDESVDTTGVSLYCRKVLIQRNAPGIVPRYLRFMRGIVDCEDVPLNIGREALQDASIVRRLNGVLAARVLKYLAEVARNDATAYDTWFTTGGMGMFIREGVCTEQDDSRRTQLAKLLRYESTSLPVGQMTGLDGAISRTQPAAPVKAIYYIVAPTRAAAESSPYLEAFRSRGVEVLLAYLPGDEVVFKMLGQLDGHSIVNVEEADISSLPPAAAKTEEASKHAAEEASAEPALSDRDMTALCEWLQNGPLLGKVAAVKPSARLTDSAALLTGHVPESLRRIQAMASAAGKAGASIAEVPATLELNPRHSLVKRLAAASSATDDEQRQALACLVAEQVLDSARVAAGDLDDPRRMLKRLTDICAAALK
jgi:HSP90 family molecular chaperone